MDTIINASEQISLFCRLHMNVKTELPIRSSEMGFLIYLVKTNEEKSANAAAKYFKVTKAMVTNMITSLLKKGYIKKQQVVEDKRRYLLVPTQKAITLVEETYLDYFKMMSILKEKMGKESFEHFISYMEIANQILLEKKNNE